MTWWFTYLGMDYGWAWFIATIIDILITVRSLAHARATMVEPISALGYLYWPDNPKPDRMFFVKGMPPHGERRTHHVHITEPDGEMRQRRVPFRDYLRAHPGEARCYEALKHDLAARHPHRTVFTRFITPRIPEEAPGQWQSYFRRIRKA